MITLDSSGSIITLPSQLSWIDEFDFTPGQETVITSITGAVIIQTGYKKLNTTNAYVTNRPITLSTTSGGDWVSRLVLKNLFASLSVDNSMTLTYHDGRSFAVKWRHADTPIETQQLYTGLTSPTDQSLYTITLRFRTV
jgi:hypothetical protein